MRMPPGVGEQARNERDQAWARLADRGARRRPPPRRRPAAGRRLNLGTIAGSYDRIVAASHDHPAAGRATPEVPDADVLAALRVLRMLREQLDADEAGLISLARQKKITWARIARELELSGRQSAERRYLQLSRTHPPQPDGAEPTQSERVEYARETRRRHAEQRWAMSRAATIHGLARRLAALDDLADRIDRSAAAHTIAAIRAADTTKPRPQAPPSRWPEALRTAVTAYERHRAGRPAGQPIPQAEAAAVHRLLGLLLFAGPRNIDLTGHRQLARDLAAFHSDLAR